MNILISIPSKSEWNILQKLWTDSNLVEQEVGVYHYQNFKIKVVLTGVGMMRTSYILKQAIDNNNPLDLAFQLGVAGGSKSLEVGSAYCISQEEAIDGIWEEGTLYTDFDLGLEDRDVHPFVEGRLHPELPEAYWKNQESQNSITTATLTDDVEWCEGRLELAEAKIENMEGASFYYVTLRECIPSLEIRGVSNHVGIRDKSQWKVEEALHSASKIFLEILEKIHQHEQAES